MFVSTSLQQHGFITWQGQKVNDRLAVAKVYTCNSLCTCRRSSRDAFTGGMRQSTEHASYIPNKGVCIQPAALCVHVMVLTHTEEQCLHHSWKVISVRIEFLGCKSKLGRS